MTKSNEREYTAVSENNKMEMENPDQEEVLEDQVEQTVEAEQEEVETTQPETVETESVDDRMAQQEDKYLRLAAEYDNYRKRTAKEKESLWTSAKAETAAAFLPVYDNLERAMKQPTADEAYKKGIEMTMNQLKEVFSKLGITEIPALGHTFDPNLHNAVMHIDDENLGENEVAEVFQAGFQCGEKVIRFAMVKVAN